ncbi:flagellar motor protein MotB [Paenibacillus popilliae]|uniref:Flagellar motor protein n=1 Tax=Paenibacillus popilliae ATCC 14706 TaxID=1212764 RepID=M9L8K7_PAEPP|nr:flagellar motor protein MotB [Paenibacillus popilliae]GAC41542.1 flagellar motor protein [Paenibacillus popilliae ATCC 14706]
MSNKRHPPHEEHVDESWLIPYADVLTLLLALFIVLYSMSSVDAQKFQEVSQAFNIAFDGGAGILDQQAIISNNTNNSDPSTASRNRERNEYMVKVKQEQAELEALLDKMNEYIANTGLSDQLNTELNHSELKITIKDSALFDSGQANLKSDAQQLAITIGDMLKEHKDHEFVISGHTDNRPIRNNRFESNWDLSSARALSFMKVVLERSGIDPKQFKAVGMGEYHPVADNGTVEGQAQNRRVEVSILRKFVDNDGLSDPSSESDNGTDAP